jgi:pimeloyl-ACP methyl ester carboxylesterase
LLAAGYAAWVRRRNARLRRPPVRGPDGVPYPSRRLVYSDGVEVTYHDVGAGLPVVMIPGADGMKETFRYQLPPFSRRYRVIVADVRDRFSRTDTFDRLADDVAERMDERGVESAIVVGQSLGGAIAIRLATRHPERVAGLVVVNSLTRMTFEHLGLNRTGLVPLARVATRYLPTDAARLLADVWSRAEVWIFDNSPGRSNIVEYALGTGPRTVPSAVSKRRVDLFRDVDLRLELPRIRVPTLVVRGPRDFYVPPGWWEEILDGVPGARCVEIPETGHCSHLSMPGAFNHAVLTWISGVCEEASRPGGDAIRPREDANRSREEASRSRGGEM